MKTPMRAGLYGRYSTEEQDDASIDDQLRVGRKHTVKLEGTVVDEYVDEALSGSALGNRPSFLRMRDDAYAGRINTIIVMELQRLARGFDLGKEIERFRFRGVRVIGVQDGFDSFAENADLQAGISGVVGKEFINMIRRRVHSALEMRAEMMRPTGGKSYGYGNDRMPIEPEATIVREIFARYAKGETMKAIASDLNARGIPSPGASWDRKIRRRDGRWLVSGIHSLLHNELYIGRLIWNRREFKKDPDSGKRVCRERPQSEWIVHEVPERAIIDRETWDRCQSRLGSLGGGQKGPARYLLSGLLVCGECGSKMNIYGGKDRRYVCGTYHGGGPHACRNRLSVPRVLAEELILAPVMSDLASPELIDEMVQMMRETERREQMTIATTPPEVERLDAEIAHLRDLVKTGVLTPHRASPAIEAAEREREVMLSGIRRRSMKDKAYTTETLRSAYLDQVGQIRETLTGSDVNEARQSLRALVGEIRLTPSGGHLVAHFRRGIMELLRTGSGVGTVVAGVRFDSTYPPVALIKKSKHGDGD
jgi:site-specific DNA recombinase